MTPTYAAYRRPTSEQKMYTDWKWRVGKKYSKQMDRKETGVSIFISDKIDFKTKAIQREGDKLQCVVVFHVPSLGTWPTSQACALTGNRTDDPLVHRLVLSPLNHTSQGWSVFLNFMYCGRHKLGPSINKWIPFVLGEFSCRILSCLSLTSINLIFEIWVTDSPLF